MRLTKNIIAIANQKGGVGKTTTVVNIGVGLAKLGKKVLLIDLDPQSNLTYHLLGKKIYELTPKDSLYEVLENGRDIREVILETEGVHLAPASIKLAELEGSLIVKRNSDVFLKNALLEIPQDYYDYILIDCPPSLGVLTWNAFTFAKEVLIPIQAEPFALQGLDSLLALIRDFSDLSLMGMLLTLFDTRRNITGEIKFIIEQRKELKKNLFSTPIRVNVSLAEASANGQSVFSYAPRSHGAKDYLSLVKEILKREKNRNRLQTPK